MRAGSGSAGLSERSTAASFRTNQGQPTEHDRHTGGRASGTAGRPGPRDPPRAPSAPAAPDHDAELDQLTPREREVLRHLARGYMYKEIALRLGISVKTVEAHVSAVLRKLQLSSRHQLSQWAAERRLLE